MKFRKMMAVALAALTVTSIVFAGCGQQSAKREEPKKEATQKASSDSLVVKTAYGEVKGTALKDADTDVWYGIPYGADTAGENRWQAPKDPEKWSDTKDCTKPGEPAMQYGDDSAKGTTDCLNLDVYVPNKGGENLPVMVFYHGGNNQTGSSQGDLTGKSFAADANCIVVTVNYRLGLLGWNCLPALMTDDNATGNFGLLDMKASLEWVQDNIAAFGGDPKNVTIGGHSAGGRDVMAMLISPMFKGLFQKAYVSSGGMTTADVSASQQKIASFIAPLAVEDGKAATEAEARQWLLGTGDDVKEYLYSIDDARLAQAVGGAGIRMSAFPHLYADGVSLPKDGFAANDYNAVPVMMVTGVDEFSMFNSGDAYTDGSIPEDQQEATKQFGWTYGSRMYGYFNGVQSAQQMVKSGYSAPIYVTNIAFGHNKDITPQLSAMGAFHGISLLIIDNQSPIRQAMKKDFATKGAMALMKDSISYMKNFLSSGKGDPNDGSLVEWTAYNASDEQILVLDCTKDEAAIAMQKPQDVSYDTIFADMDADTTVTPEAKQAVIRTVLNGRWFSAPLDEHYGNPDLWTVQ